MTDRLDGSRAIFQLSATARSGHGSTNDLVDRPDRPIFVEHDFSRSRRFAAGRSGHGSTDDLVDRPDRPIFVEHDFSRFRRFAAGRSGHGSTDDLVDKDRIAPFLWSL